MKVVHVISSLDKKYGGPSRSVPHLCEIIAKNNIDTTLLSLKSNSPNFPKSYSNLRTKLFPYFHPRKLSYSKELNGELKTIETDIFHGHGIWQLPTHQMASIAFKRKIPFLITPRGMLEEWSLKQKQIQKKIFLKLFQYNDLKRSSCIHATALNEYKSVRKLGLKNPVAIIPNGINTSIYKPKQKASFKEKKKILFLSRIHQKKGLNFLIEAWAVLSKKYLDWQILIVGIKENSYVEEIEKLIKKYNLTESIEIKNPVYGSEKIKLYQESDLFVLPTHSENYGIVVAEALSCGLPVITTTGTPWSDLNSNNCGWWIEIGAEPLIKAMDEALSLSGEQRQMLGQNGRKLIIEKYSIETSGLMMTQTYEWLLGRREKPDCVLLE